MPTYVYRSLSDPEVTYELKQSIHDAAFTRHPDSGDPLRRIMASGVVIRQRGLKKTTRVDKRSPAATACGCASHAALNALGMAKTTSRYDPANKRVSAGHSHGPSQRHNHRGHCGPSHHKN